MPSKDPTWLSGLAGLGGLLFGAALTVATIYGSANFLTPLSNFHHTISQQREDFFALSIGQDVYFLCLTLALIVGAIALFRRSLSTSWRAFFGFACLPLFGFWALCSFISVGDLFRPHQ